MDYAAARRAMVDSQLRPQAVTDPRVVAAMATVPRERFVPAAAQEIAYIDRTLPLGNGRALTPAATLGRMLVELEVKAGERVLLIGAATGYTAAILSELGCDVVAVESDPALADQLAGASLPHVRLVRGELSAGAPNGAPYDLILIDGAVEVIPDALIEQLAVGGRLGACLIERGVQRLVIGRRTAGGFGLKSYADASAAPLPGFALASTFSF
jgi:protein-L-isoaspartate(D-aspartate) O-methyltransferase